MSKAVSFFSFKIFQKIGHKDRIATELMLWVHFLTYTLQHLIETKSLATAIHFIPRDAKGLRGTCEIIIKMGNWNALKIVSFIPSLCAKIPYMH